MAASHDGLSRAVLVALVILLAGVVVWQRSARPSAGTAAPASPSHGSRERGVRVLPSTRLQHPVDLSLAGIREMPPRHTATPKVSARRAIAAAKAGHTPGAVSVQAVLVVVTDPSAGLSKTLAWDVREAGCFGTQRGSAGTTPPACDRHRLVIVNARSGALVETVTY